jgi:hypothetical protein
MGGGGNKKSPIRPNSAKAGWGTYQRRHTWVVAESRIPPFCKSRIPSFDFTPQINTPQQILLSPLSTHCFVFMHAVEILLLQMFSIYTTSTLDNKITKYTLYVKKILQSTHLNLTTWHQPIYLLWSILMENVLQMLPVWNFEAMKKKVLILVRKVISHI